ncbi:MAG: hypothetical protein EOO38_05030 [Cytophagaceae bacterium]|nr:MAG: hypothetical protein EOO38_05030 [Cytophagaceae bacterium]
MSWDHEPNLYRKGAPNHLAAIYSYELLGWIKDNVVTNASLAPDSVNATTIVDDSITESQLSSATRTKLNASANAVLLTTNQTILGEKTFSSVLRSPTLRAEGQNSIQVGGGEYPSVAIVNGSNTITSQVIADPSNGSLLMDYTAALGGSFYVRSDPQGGTAMLTINTAGSTFANKIIAPSLQITGTSPAVGKVLTSDASG